MSSFLGSANPFGERPKPRRLAPVAKALQTLLGMAGGSLICTPFAAPFWYAAYVIGGWPAAVVAFVLWPGAILAWADRYA